MRVDLSALAGDFPDFSAAVVLFEDIAVTPARPPALASEIAARRAAAKARWGGGELADVPGIKAWRLAYKRFGIKSTRYRCSVERIVKNVLADRDLPEINTFVDAYNAVSLAHVFPIGADDLDRVTGDLAFRYARDGDTFLDMAGGGEEGEGGGEDPPKPGEVVWADGEKVLCRRWNWRQDARSLVQPETRRVVLTIQSFGVGDLDAAVADLIDLVTTHCGGRARAIVLDAARPSADLGI